MEGDLSRTTLLLGKSLLRKNSCRSTAWSSSAAVHKQQLVGFFCLPCEIRWSIHAYSVGVDRQTASDYAFVRSLATYAMDIGLMYL